MFITFINLMIPNKLNRSGKVDKMTRIFIAGTEEQTKTHTFDFDYSLATTDS